MCKFYLFFYTKLGKFWHITRFFPIKNRKALSSTNYCQCVLLYKLINQNTTKHFFYLRRFGLYERPSSEEVCLLPLPVLATIVMRRGKKSVVRVAECIAALVPVHLLTCLLTYLHLWLIMTNCWYHVQANKPSLYANNFHVASLSRNL